MSQITPRIRLRLATAHGAFGVCILVAAVVAEGLRERLPSSEALSALAAPLQLAFACGWLYVALAAFVHLATGAALRRDRFRQSSAMLWLAVSYGLMIGAAIQIARHAPESAIYSAGLEGLLAVLFTISLIGLILSLATWQRTRPAPPAETAMAAWYWTLGPAHLLTGLLAIGVLLWIDAGGK